METETQVWKCGVLGTGLDDTHKQTVCGREIWWW
jgi:hypothetical protein